MTEERQRIVDRCAEIWPDKKVILVQTDEVDNFVTLEGDPRVHTLNSDLTLCCTRHPLLPGTGMHLDCCNYQLDRFIRELQQATDKREAAYSKVLVEWNPKNVITQ